ncbi:MAG: hypothetical protein IKH56_02890 [Oscillospiraceae bacterium]|nr:hypothetical protein [Oscillospiraceae bacterium]
MDEVETPVRAVTDEVEKSAQHEKTPHPTSFHSATFPSRGRHGKGRKSTENIRLAEKPFQQYHQTGNDEHQPSPQREGRIKAVVVKLKQAWPGTVTPVFSGVILRCAAATSSWRNAG